MTNREQGQTLSEYVLAAALVALVGVGALVVLGNVLQAQLPALLDEIFGTGSAEGTAVAAAPAGPDASTGAPMDDPLTAPDDVMMTQKSLSLPGGETLDLSGYPEDLLKSVETAGANGTTKKLLSQMDQLIQKLEASGEADPASLASLKALSNQGHRLAEIQQIVEAEAGKTPDPQALLQQQVSWNGKNYSVEQLSQMLGTSQWPKDMGGDPLASTAFRMDSENQLKEFVNLYKKLETSGALADPATRDTVRSLATEIAFLSETVEHVVNTTAVSAGEVKMKDLAAAEMTHLKSGGICQAGGNSDSGVRCH